MEVEVEDKEFNTTRSIRLSNVLLVMPGQSNWSPRNVPAKECSWGQVEHPLLKGVHEEEDETGGVAGGVVIQKEGHQDR